MTTLKDTLPLDIVPYHVQDKKTGLVVIDVIKGFCEVGAGNLAPIAYSQPMVDMLAHVNTLSKQCVEKQIPIFSFIDSHHADIPEPPYPPHCIEGTAESELMDELKWFYAHPGVTCYEKDCINAYIGAINKKTGENVFEKWVSDNQFETLIFVGVCTDICVADCVVTTLSACNHGLLSALKDVVVYLPGCATYDMTPGHPQDIMHHIGAKIMYDRGALLANQIILK